MSGDIRAVERKGDHRDGPVGSLSPQREMQEGEGMFCRVLGVRLHRKGTSTGHQGEDSGGSSALHVQNSVT